MWQRIARVTGFGLLLTAGMICQAQENNPQANPGQLVAGSKWLRLDLILGRMTIVEARLGKNLKANAGAEDGSWRESLSFSARSPDSASLNYEFVDQQQQLILEIDHSNQVLIERKPLHGSDVVPIRFVQPVRGKITLIVDHPNSPREIAASSFWHLMLAEPQTCAEHLVPIIESLRTDWRLNDQLAAVERTLLATTRVPNYERMDALVRQLSSKSFTDRQTADRELRNMGPALVAYINRLDLTRLDAEQRYRLRKIKRLLTAVRYDSSERVAAWLSDDREAWFALLSRDDQKHRETAANRLALICGKRLDFDPAAEPIDRQRQVNRLRFELGLADQTQIGSLPTPRDRR